MNKRIVSLLAVLIAILLLTSCEALAMVPEEASRNANSSVMDVETSGENADTPQEDSCETVSKPAPQTIFDHPIPFSMQKFRISGRFDGEFSGLVIVKSVEELQAYCDTYQSIYHDTSPYAGLYDFSITDYYDNTKFLDSIEKFDQDFFEKSFVIFVMLNEPSDSISHKIDGISGEGAITINRIIPGSGNWSEMKWKFIFILDNQYKDVLFHVDMVTTQIIKE